MRCDSWSYRFAVVLLGTIVATAAFGRDVTVTLKNGTKVVGELVSETPTAVTLKVNGTPTPFNRSQIASISGTEAAPEPAAPAGPAGEITKALAKLKADDYDARYKVLRSWYDKAEALVKEKKDAAAVAIYKPLKVELEKLIKDKPSLRTTVTLEAVKESLSKIKVEDPGGVVEPGTGPGKPAGPAGLIAEQDVNLLKVYEIDLSVKPRVQKLPRKVVEDIFKSSALTSAPSMEKYVGAKGKAAFLKLDGWQQLDMLFGLQARELYNHSRVLQEPATLMTFRTKIHTSYIQAHCGKCHSGGKTKGLNVVTKKDFPRAKPMQLEYTNLLLLRRSAAGAFNLIETATPEKSPLLHFGLPSDQTATPHPAVDGKAIQPFFRQGKNDPLYKQWLKWIDDLYDRDYPIKIGGAAAAGDAG